MAEDHAENEAPYLAFVDDHEPDDMTGYCSCGLDLDAWPDTSISTFDQAYRRHLALVVGAWVLRKHADREYAHEGATMAVERVLAHAAEYVTPPAFTSPEEG